MKWHTDAANQQQWGDADPWSCDGGGRFSPVARIKINAKPWWGKLQLQGAQHPTRLCSSPVTCLEQGEKWLSCPHICLLCCFSSLSLSKDMRFCACRGWSTWIWTRISSKNGMDTDSPIGFHNSEGSFFFSVSLSELNLIPCRSQYVLNTTSWMNEFTGLCGVCIFCAAHGRGRGW